MCISLPNPGDAHAHALAGLTVRGSHVEEEPRIRAVNVLTLAVATGANAVVFSVMNGRILRPLNVPQAESLYTVENAQLTRLEPVLSQLSRSARSQRQL
jgi:hypothetical protein